MPIKRNNEEIRTAADMDVKGTNAVETPLGQKGTDPETEGGQHSYQKALRKGQPRKKVGVGHLKRGRRQRPDQFKKGPHIKVIKERVRTRPGGTEKSSGNKD